MITTGLLSVGRTLTLSLLRHPGNPLTEFDSLTLNRLSQLSYIATSYGPHLMAPAYQTHAAYNVMCLMDFLPACAGGIRACDQKYTVKQSLLCMRSQWRRLPSLSKKGETKNLPESLSDAIVSKWSCYGREVHEQRVHVNVEVCASKTNGCSKRLQQRRILSADWLKIHYFGQHQGQCYVRCTEYQVSPHLEMSICTPMLRMLEVVLRCMLLEDVVWNSTYLLPLDMQI